MGIRFRGFCMKTRKTYWPGDEHFGVYAIGEYGRDSWVCALEYLTHRRTYVDVGAHIGHYVYHALGSFKEVIAFEPRAKNYGCLTKNVEERKGKLKRSATVRLFKAAVGDVEKHQAGVLWIDPSEGKNSGAWEFVMDEDSPERLDILTIDALKLEHCDLIKIDTQGWEGRVIQGARETVARCKPVLIVEVVNNDNVNSGLIDSIKKMGYTGRAMLTKNMVFCAR